jgi:predicted ATP-grasp superfamily ATP-dependent carboligase
MRGMHLDLREGSRLKRASVGDAVKPRDGRFSSRRKPADIPAVVLGGTGPGTLGVVRSLSRAGVPVILLNDSAFSPAMHSRYGRKVVISATRGKPLVEELLAVAETIGGPAVLFLNSDDAVLTVSRYRAELAKHFLFQLPSHACLNSLIHKTAFQKLAETLGFPVPRSQTIDHEADLSRLAELRFPCIVKPTRATPGYAKGKFARAYKVTSPEEAVNICRRILATVSDLVVQEWIGGPDSELYFCLQYRGVNGAVVCSFTGRKLSIWPPDVGVTASCTAAPAAREALQSLTEAFFERVSFIGMGSIEFKRDISSGQFLMIEPTVGRVNGQEEVATLHGANIPLAAYLYEIGEPVPLVEEDPPPVVWRDSLSHLRFVHANRSSLTTHPNARICDAYWRADDPVPVVFHFLGRLVGLFRKIRRRVPLQHRLNVVHR